MKIINLVLSAVFISALTLSCSGEKKEDKSEDKSESKNGWDDKSRERFIKECMTGLNEEVCKCSLEKIESKLKPSDMDKNDGEIVRVLSLAMKECNGG